MTILERVNNMSNRQALFNEIETLPENYVDLALQTIIIIKQGGVPFETEFEMEEDTIPPLSRPYDRDEWLREAIACREAGVGFLTIEESLAGLREAIKRGAENGV